MEYTILRKRSLIPERVSELVVNAPHIAAKARPGNFVILRLCEGGERIPLTIADTDKERGTITIVYLVLGKTTALLETFAEGQAILDVCGPLGRPTDIHKVGTVICTGGGTGIAAMHHIAKGHHLAGNRVVSVIGSRSKDLLLFHEELTAISDEVLVSTDDGSFGHKGLVTEVLEQRIQEARENRETIGEIVAVGPVPMMRAVAKVTEPYGIKTTVSLNSIMVDGIGMCGACRVTVGGTIRFACVDGPEFDAQQVDFDELHLRLGTFRPQEELSYNQFCQSHAKQKD
ncbi:MAG: sulfide/dihydroorotate dehydrogenase-like FAD/NAD-binding protein [Desulfohalobiaceae bacterium]